MLALPVLLASQAQYPYLYHVDVAANVAHDQGTQLYHYVYSLANDQSSAGKIAGFEIDISRSEDIADLDTVGLRFENDGYTEKIFRRNFAKFAGRIVPVGFFRTPEGHWSGGNTNNLTASFDGIVKVKYFLVKRPAALKSLARDCREFGSTLFLLILMLLHCFLILLTRTSRNMSLQKIPFDRL